METLSIDEAADFLRMNPEVLRRKAKKNKVPGRKVGKCWVFVKQHLVDYIGEEYYKPCEKHEIDTTKEDEKCQSINVVKLGGFNSPRQTESAYSNLLGLKTNKKPKSCTTV